MFLAQIDNLAEKLPEVNSTNTTIGVGIGVLIVGFVVYWLLFSGKRKVNDSEKGLRENLAEYPKAPGKPSSRRLMVQGVPVRIRLLVLALGGKQEQSLDVDDAGEYLDGILLGMSSILDVDKPRVKIWPRQYSLNGFAPTFHRLVASPDVQGSKSHWILAAGQAKSRGMTILVGMALYADMPVKMGQIHLKKEDWLEMFQLKQQLES